jgi:hypothetical protein
VEEVIALVWADPDAGRAGELFDCLFAEDAVVRMRAADALEKVALRRPELVAPFMDRLLTDAAAIDQPSVQWHIAQIVTEVPLSPEQRRRAIALLQYNLESAHDWIVLNLTMEALAHFARGDADLAAWLKPALRPHTSSKRKSIAKRAAKLVAELERPS